MPLLSKVAAVASAGIVVAMALVASLLANHVEDAIVQRAAGAVALHMDSFVQPLIQDLATDNALSPEKRDELEKLFSAAAIGRPVVSFRIWLGELVIFSSHRDLIGRRFDLNDARRGAFDGHVSANFDTDGDDDVQERALNVPILEVYAPVRQIGSGRVIAVAETYEIALGLKAEIWAARAMSYAAFGAIALALIYLLFSLVDRGAREVSRISTSNRRVSEMNERQMWRMGSDLREGPVQLVALALLKLDSIRELVGKLEGAAPTPSKDLDAVRGALNNALAELREVSAGLVPPQIERLSLAETIHLAVRKHESRTGAVVTCHIGRLSGDTSFSVKACLYRFVGEALQELANRGCRSKPTIRAAGDGATVEVEVFGLPIDSERALVRESLSKGFRDRVESLGGTFLASFRPDETSLTARFRIGECQ